MLTNAAVKAAGALSRAYKISDGRDLHLHVARTGRRTFRFRFRWRGHEQLLTIGAWPDVSIADARALAEVARAQLRRGLDPRGATPIDTFEATARAWHAHRRPRWSTAHAGDVLASLERHVFPAIGALQLGAIDAPRVLALVQGIEAGGAFETARRVRQRISMVFGFAIARKLATFDPAAAIARELGVAPATRRQPALTDPAAARALYAAIGALEAAPAAKLAAQFLALTAVRLAAVRGARWEEIEDLDGPAPIWRVPAVRMKLARAKKADAANDHVVPLSAAAVTVLRAAFEIDPAAGVPVMHIFPGRGDAAPVSARAIGDLIARTPFAGRHVPHGWRASFATILNEAMPAERDAIDRALAHAAKDKVEAAYNRAEQLARRRRLFDAWADILIA